MSPRKNEAVSKLTELVENLLEEVRANGQIIASYEQSQAALTERVMQLDLALRGGDPLGGQSLAVRLNKLESLAREARDKATAAEKKAESREKALEAERKRALEVAEKKNHPPVPDERKNRTAIVLAIIAALTSLGSAALHMWGGKPTP